MNPGIRLPKQEKGLPRFPPKLSRLGQFVKILSNRTWKKGFYINLSVEFMRPPYLILFLMTCV